MKLMYDLLERSANSVSTNAATERAATRAGSYDGDNSGRSSLSLWRFTAGTPSMATGTTPTNNNSASNSMILACSVPPGPSRSVQSLQGKLNAARRKNLKLTEISSGKDADGYPLCEYRKSFFDHLKPKSLITSTLRVATQQATSILANFMTEQLDHDLKRNALVNTGKLTQLDADLQAEDWEKAEWEIRWKAFPHKFVVALLKFHAITLTLRVYEYIAAKLVDLQFMDKLTMDPFGMSKRLVTKIEHKHPSGQTVRDHKVYVFSKMTETTFWANLLMFCADYSLHQGLLCYGYYKYYNYKRQKRISQAPSSGVDDDDKPNKIGTVGITDEDKVLAKDIASKSFRLAANRGVGLVCSAVGAWCWQCNLAGMGYNCCFLIR